MSIGDIVLRDFIMYFEYVLGVIQKILLFIFISFSTLSLILIYVSTAWNSYLQYKDVFYVVKMQTCHLVFGCLILYWAIVMNYKKHCRYARVLLLLNLTILCVVYFTELGVKAGGAKRWLGYSFFRFQPGELLKISLIYYLSFFLSRKYYFMQFFLYGLAEPIGFLLLSVSLLLLQPDFGTAVILFIIAFCMMFVSKARLEYVILCVFLSVLFFFHIAVTSNYRFVRLATAFNPWDYQKGAGYQILQSLTMIELGGYTGRMGGQSIFDLDTLPAAHTDFILSVLGTYLGGGGILLVMCMYVVILIVGFYIANFAVDNFSFYMLIGVTVLFAIQALFNICVVLGVFPTKGLTLPLLSYGGSSLFVNCWIIGTIYRGIGQLKALYS